MPFIINHLWFCRGCVSRDARLPSWGSEWSWFLPTYEAFRLETVALTKESNCCIFYTAILSWYARQLPYSYKDCYEHFYLDRYLKLWQNQRMLQSTKHMHHHRKLQIRGHVEAWCIKKTGLNRDARKSNSVDCCWPKWKAGTNGRCLQWVFRDC